MNTADPFEQPDVPVYVPTDWAETLNVRAIWDDMPDRYRGDILAARVAVSRILDWGTWVDWDCPQDAIYDATPGPF